MTYHLYYYKAIGVQKIVLEKIAIIITYRIIVILLFAFSVI